jgi:hypothetical protein|tara:strand:- start:307 stop:513 length:207 start_codon:yes stop_codon:yes gene_type:complete
MNDIDKLQKEIEGLKKTIKGLQKDLDVLFEINTAKLERAVCEMQEYLGENRDFYVINKINAPTRVGMK